MPTRNKTAKPSAPSSQPVAPENAPADRFAHHMAGQQQLAASVPYNALTRTEHGLEHGHAPTPGVPVEASEADTASTVTEDVVSAKLGSGKPQQGHNATVGPLDRVRADASGQRLTTNQGVPIGDNQNSLKAGLRGPTLLEDFILREKITHFDHERIPERIVHARGSAAHGYFECTESAVDLTRASLLSEAGKRTPVFVRFSTVAGERGSPDLARDVRGFAVKFYTDEGNWDLVGNNIPVFFIQDAMKFPDLIHAVKPEPHNGMPQAASAHDTFWDFASLMPESAHMLMWVMSDRALPRSYRMMQGFGVHTFRLVNADGDSVFVKFHWNPVAGTHSVLWDEAVKINGADADFHRHDLWDAIEAGNYPAWDLGLQVFSEEEADGFPFDVLDATKLVPEELVPLRTVGRLVLNRNPDNFFAETEQVAFCTAHVVPGIDFSNDPLLQGRIHSYVDTQLSRLGGPNFHEIPINAPIAPVHNNQRDGLHRQALHRGRVAYEPNSLGGGCPFQAGMAGFVSHPAPVFEDKVRGKPEKFADHYSQASLFYRSQTAVEQAHIAAAFRFELSRVQVPAIRERVVALLRNVDEGLAQQVSQGLGMTELPSAQPLVMEAPAAEPAVSQALSLFARPGDGSVRGRRVALLVAEGADGASLRAAHDALLKAGAVPRLVAPRLGSVKTADGSDITADTSLFSMPSVLWDAAVLPDGAAALTALAADGLALEFVKEQYRHCKPMLVLGAGATLLDAAGIPRTLVSGDSDPGLVFADSGDKPSVRRFIGTLALHRRYERETDPPRV
jgi:catalase